MLSLKEGEIVDILIVSNADSQDVDIIKNIEIVSISDMATSDEYHSGFGIDETIYLKVKGVDNDLIKLAKSKSYGKLEILKSI